MVPPTVMAYSHCTGKGTGRVQVHGAGLKTMGPYLLYRNVHTDLRQGRNQDPLFLIVPVPVRFPCSVNHKRVRDDCLELLGNWTSLPCKNFWRIWCEQVTLDIRKVSNFSLPIFLKHLLFTDTPQRPNPHFAPLIQLLLKVFSDVMIYAVNDSALNPQSCSTSKTLVRFRNSARRFHRLQDAINSSWDYWEAVRTAHNYPPSMMIILQFKFNWSW